MASSLESNIDDLYRGPLAGFVDARTALAKTLTGADAQRVRKLAKPTIVPWAVNQVYWHARSLYDRLMKSGERLREAQVAALEGRKADVRAATETHRLALADAVQQAERFAAQAGSQPGPDALMRTFEALSLTGGGEGPGGDKGEAPGRLTKPLQLAGFEALAGIKVKAQPAAARPQPAVTAKTSVKAAAPVSPKADAASRTKDEAAHKKQEAARKKQEAEVRRAEAALERARQRMAEAEAALKRTRERR